MILMALIHLLMIPITYLLGIFPFLKPIVEAPLEILLNLSEWIQG